MENKNDALLFEETKKRLQSLLEYTVMPYNGGIDEEDQEPQTQDGQIQNGESGMPQDAGMNGNANQMPMGGSMQGQDEMGVANTPDGFSPQFDDNAAFGGGDISNNDFEGVDTPSPDDDVVDITEFTDSQKEAEKDIEKLDNKFSTLIKQLGSFEELIRQNDAKIEDLKAEFEKRNPTQIEKLSMNSAKGYPFNTSVDDYWKEKEATSNYSPDDDNNGKGQGQYVITKNDINGGVDWKSISDSMDDDDFMYNQTLNGVLKY